MIARTEGWSDEIESAVAEIQRRVAMAYPAADLEVFEGEDPSGVYVRATVDLDDTEPVVDTVLDYLLEVQVERRLPVYFVTSQPVARALAWVRGRPG